MLGLLFRLQKSFPSNLPFAQFGCHRDVIVEDLVRHRILDGWSTAELADRKRASQFRNQLSRSGNHQTSGNHREVQSQPIGEFHPEPVRLQNDKCDGDEYPDCTYHKTWEQAPPPADRECVTIQCNILFGELEGELDLWCHRFEYRSRHNNSQKWEPIRDRCGPLSDNVFTIKKVLGVRSEVNCPRCCRCPWHSRPLGDSVGLWYEFWLDSSRPY